MLHFKVEWAINMRTFDKARARIIVSEFPSLEMRAVNQSDMEHIRQWKNEQKQYFFSQEDISFDQQMQWYESFVKRPYDLMFIIVYDYKAIGCMGIRWQDDHWDVYNVILGIKEFGRRGLMGKAFLSMLNYAAELKPALITLQVLKINPAVKWYLKHGFYITEKHESFFVMKYRSRFISGC